MLIEVIIPTYNRLDLLKQTIASVQQQQFSIPAGFVLKIVVSDNSTDDETENYFAEVKPADISYRRRRPSLAVLDHLKIIFQNVQGDYFMVFHDDDIMCSNLLSVLISEIGDTNIAIGCNAFVLKNNEPTTKRYFEGLDKPYLITRQRELLKPYLEQKQSIPFPGYLYKREASEIDLDYRYGKHIDVFILSQVLNRGTIKILDEPLYYYRIHGGQDSFTADFSGKSNLIRYIIKHCGLTRTDKLVITCRLYNIYDELRTRIWNSGYNNKGRILGFIKLCLFTNNGIIAAKLCFRIIQKYTK